MALGSRRFSEVLGVSSTLSRADPIRTCIGCRRRAPRSTLLRVVAVRDTVGDLTTLLPDPRRVLPGRGASLHPDPGCLEAADRRRAFTRALRVVGPFDVHLLRELLSTQQ